MTINGTTTHGDERTLFAKYTGINTSLIAHIVISSDNILESCSQSRAATIAVSNINNFLSFYGVPNKSLLTNDEFVLAGLTIIITLFSYYILMGKGHRKKRRRLAADLKIAQEKVHFLEERLMILQEDETKKGGEVRIFMDGAFDMMHYGHMNAFRLARSLGTHLVVGVNSDESIKECKGPPLMNDEERLTMVQGCKFVDDVVPECPYVMNSEYLNYIIKEYKIDYVIHGDDPCIVDGKDVYEAAKKAGKYQSIPRTEGVSTTDIVGRMLLMNKDHHCNSSPVVSGEADKKSLLCEQSKFLTTSRMLRLFSAGMKSPKHGQKIVYIDGAWDMFHCGHIKILEAAKKRGDFLIVGIHGDALVNRERGCNLPLMNLHERVLSVLGCRFVDDVLIDAPSQISPQMIKSLQIDEVVHGTNDEDFGGCDDNNDRYKYAKAANIFVQLKSPSKFSLSRIIDRIQAHSRQFQAKIAKKKKAEEDFYKHKYSEAENE